MAQLEAVEFMVNKTLSDGVNLNEVVPSSNAAFVTNPNGGKINNILLYKYDTFCNKRF